MCGGRRPSMRRTSWRSDLECCTPALSRCCRSRPRLVAGSDTAHQSPPSHTARCPLPASPQPGFLPAQGDRHDPAARAARGRARSRPSRAGADRCQTCCSIVAGSGAISSRRAARCQPAIRGHAWYACRASQCRCPSPGPNRAASMSSGI